MILELEVGNKVLLSKMTPLPDTARCWKKNLHFVGRKEKKFSSLHLSGRKLMFNVVGGARTRNRNCWAFWKCFLNQKCMQWTWKLICEVQNAEIRGSHFAFLRFSDGRKKDIPGLHNLDALFGNISKSKCRNGVIYSHLSTTIWNTGHCSTSLLGQWQQDIFFFCSSCLFLGCMPIYRMNLDQSRFSEGRTDGLHVHLHLSLSLCVCVCKRTFAPAIKKPRWQM